MVPGPRSAKTAAASSVVEVTASDRYGPALTAELRVWIDQDLCTGDGLCTDHAPAVFTILEDGIAYCLDARTGTVVYEERISPRPGRIYASGVLADGRIYYVSREEGTFVIDAAPRYRLLAHNQMETDKSIFNATPAISRGQLLLRSNKFLYCIGEKP